jgi:AcrR family transcriptional regulator
MNLRDLCGETGLSMGGLYGYITSKDQLAEMIEDVVRHATHEVPKMYTDITDPLDRLEALIRASIYVSEILQPWFYFVFMDSRVLQAEQRSTAKESELHVQALFADHRAAAAGRRAARTCWRRTSWPCSRTGTSSAGSTAPPTSVRTFADSAVRMMRGYLSACAQRRAGRHRLDVFRVGRRGAGAGAAPAGAGSTFSAPAGLVHVQRVARGVAGELVVQPFAVHLRQADRHGRSCGGRLCIATFM